VGPETKIQKYRATHQVVTMLLIFLMGVALGWVLRGGPGVKEDRISSVETVGAPAGKPVETEAPALPLPAGEEAAPGQSPAPAEVAAPAEPPVPEGPPAPEGPAEAEPVPAQESAGALDVLEDVWPARHLIIAVNGSALNAEAKSFLSEVKPGGVVLLKNNIQNREQTIKLVASIKEAVGLGKEI